MASWVEKLFRKRRGPKDSMPGGGDEGPGREAEAGHTGQLPTEPQSARGEEGAETQRPLASFKTMVGFNDSLEVLRERIVKTAMVAAPGSVSVGAAAGTEGAAQAAAMQVCR